MSGDLTLGEVLDEAHAQDRPFALIKLSAVRGELRFHSVIAVLNRLERLDPWRRLLLIRAPGRIERERLAGMVGLEGLEDILNRKVQAVGQLARRGKAPELVGE